VDRGRRNGGEDTPGGDGARGRRPRRQSGAGEEVRGAGDSCRREWREELLGGKNDIRAAASGRPIPSRHVHAGGQQQSSGEGDVETAEER
jgi:hypothetical protein